MTEALVDQTSYPAQLSLSPSCFHQKQQSPLTLPSQSQSTKPPLTTHPPEEGLLVNQPKQILCILYQLFLPCLVVFLLPRNVLRFWYVTQTLPYPSDTQVTWFTFTLPSCLVTRMIGIRGKFPGCCPYWCSA